MVSICKDEDMPSDRTVERWINSNPEVSSVIAHARETGFDAIALDCLEISDNSRNDYIDKLADDGDEQAERARVNGEHIQRSKLRVDTRLKLLAKWDPKRYGDKMDLNHGGQTGNPVMMLIAEVDGTTFTPADDED